MLIFLDIDGVLNSTHYSLSNRSGKSKIRWIDPNAVEILNDIIFHTQAEVVLSSTWRKMYSIEKMREMMREVWFIWEIISYTPVLKANHRVHRWAEIEQWLFENWYESIFRRYVILDDDSDMLYNQKENFFLCDHHYWLTRNVAYRVKNFLNSFKQ